MQDTFSTSDEWKVASETEHINLLTDPDLQPMLFKLIRKAHSVSDISKEIGIPLNVGYYRVTRLFKAGIVEIVHETSRNGRSIKFYQITSPWFVHFSDMKQMDAAQALYSQVEPRLKRFIENIMKSLYASQQLGLLLDLQYGEPVLRICHVNGSDPFRDSSSLIQWGTLRMKPESARDYIEKLKKLHQEFDGDIGNTYTVGIFLTPGHLE